MPRTLRNQHRNPVDERIGPSAFEAHNLRTRSCKLESSEADRAGQLFQKRNIEFEILCAGDVRHRHKTMLLDCRVFGLCEGIGWTHRTISEFMLDAGIDAGSGELHRDADAIEDRNFI